MGPVLAAFGGIAFISEQESMRLIASSALIILRVGFGCNKTQKLKARPESRANSKRESGIPKID